MTQVTSYKPGTFCWNDLSTTDPTEAKRFYGELFGWKTEDQPVPGGPPYTMCRMNGKDVSGLMEVNPEQKSKGVPPYWLSYVAVASADETAKKIEQFGGKVVTRPFDVMDAGRMAVANDPQGATFGLWQPKKHIGTQLVNEPGAPCWNELMTSNVDQATSFYTRLFGWKTRIDQYNGMKYTVCLRDDEPAAGLMATPKEIQGTPPHWLTYFATDDCDRATNRAKSMKGQVITEPRDVPKIGRFAILKDPQGAHFAVIKLAPM